MELTKERLIGIIVSAIVIAALGLYIFLYRPLINQLKAARLEYKALEPQLIEAHQAASSLKNINLEKHLTREEDISFAIDELTRTGNAVGINFSSFKPQDVQKANAPYRILPIRTEIESAYDQIGIFLGSLDDLQKSLVTVDSFDITSDKKDPARLKTVLSVRMYLKGLNDTK